MSGSSGRDRRLTRFLAFLAIWLIAGGAYLFYAAQRDRPGAPPATSRPAPEGQITLDRVRSGPHIYYRSVRDGEFGRIVVASLAAPEALRIVTELSCTRAHFTRTSGLCMLDNRANLQPLAHAYVLDRTLQTRHRVDLPGFPSRTRVSKEGRYAATTVFVAGHDYNADFSTQTLLIENETGEELPDLEQFTAYKNGKRFREVDFNYWGVTFTEDSNRFYATLGSSGTTYLVEGDVSAREIRTLRENVECPSLSPDGRRIAFKKRREDGQGWRLHVLDLSTLEDRVVAQEERSIDDQVEWLDDEHLLYGVVASRGLPHDAMNIWRAPAPAGTGAGGTASARGDDAPEIFIAGAASPAVVR